MVKNVVKTKIFFFDMFFDVQNSMLTHLEVADFNETDTSEGEFVVANVGDKSFKRMGGLHVHLLSKTWHRTLFFTVF